MSTVDGPGTPSEVVEVGAALTGWVAEVTGATSVRLERRSAGGSRAGYAVEADLPDGTVRMLWLRCDTGVGPQSGGHYTVRREAAVYRELHRLGRRVAEVIAVHPSADAFLMERLHGRNWFSEVTDPVEQLSIATEFMEELGAVHRIDVADLDLPQLGPLRPLNEHVLAEIDIWEEQYRVHDVPEPTIELALDWLRRELPDQGAWPVVLAQGDSGPGNFMFDGSHLVAITDWELAHFGDAHDDLGWIYVHDLQEPMPDLPARLHDWERASGHRVDPARLRYFLVLAQARCAIGTRAGLLARDSRGEIASHLIYTTLHTRALADALATATGVQAGAPESSPDPGASSRSWMYDVALDDLRTRIVPALDDGFASRRAKGVARLVKYLREEDRLGPALWETDRLDLAGLLDRPLSEVDDTDAARRELGERIRAGTIDHSAVVVYCVRDWGRRTQVLRPAMGSLADRRHAPLPPLGGSEPLTTVRNTD